MKSNKHWVPAILFNSFIAVALLVGGCDPEDLSCFDEDGDGFDAITLSCPVGDDCKDWDISVHPGAVEICDNGDDDDCNGMTDCDDPACGEDPACDPCEDADQDGYQAVDEACPGGNDCDDADPAVNPGTLDICTNGVDDDCDGSTDCDDTECQYDPDCNACEDKDQDGFDADDGTCPTGDDCDDNDPLVNPDQLEICDNGKDDDCNGPADCSDSDCDDDPACNACVDNDSDGHDAVDPNCPGSDDCADDDALVNPDMFEICDNDKDDDCDDSPDCADEDCANDPACVACLDNDSDGHNGITDDCPDGTDCNDDNAQVHPDMAEICDNGVDDDCSTGTPDVFDGDSDGSDCTEDCNDDDGTVFPAASEVCNNDKDGTPDCKDPLLALLGGTGSDIGYAILALDDGRIVLGGGTGSFTVDNNSDNWLVFLNPDLTIDDQLRFGSPDADSVADMLLTPTGNLMVLSQTFGYGNGTSNLQITEVDPSTGNINWARVIQTTEDHAPTALTRSGDVYSASSTIWGIEPRIGFTYDLTGDGTRVIRSGGALEGTAYTVAPGSNGSFLIGGCLNGNAFIGEIPPDCSGISGHTFDAERVFTLYPAGNDQYLTTFTFLAQTPGERGTGVAVYNPQGTLTSAWTMESAGNYLSIEQLVPLQNGGYWMTGFGMGATDDQIFIANVAPSGGINFAWSMAGPGWEFPGGATITSTGRFWALGSSTSFGAGPYDWVLMSGVPPDSCDHAADFNMDFWAATAFSATPFTQGTETETITTQDLDISPTATDGSLSVLCE